MPYELNCREEMFRNIICKWCDNNEISEDFDIDYDLGIIAFGYFNNYDLVKVNIYKSFEEICDRCFYNDIVVSSNDYLKSIFTEYEYVFLTNYLKEDQDGEEFK